jgi:hypothetical protein
MCWSFLGGFTVVADRFTCASCCIGALEAREREIVDDGPDHDAGTYELADAISYRNVAGACCLGDLFKTTAINAPHMGVRTPPFLVARQ